MYEMSTPANDGLAAANIDLAEDRTATIAKALRMLGATIGTDADLDELTEVAAYAEAVLVALAEEYPCDTICPECLSTNLKSDAGTGCPTCRY